MMLAVSSEPEHHPSRMSEQDGQDVQGGGGVLATTIPAPFGGPRNRSGPE
jgi:hypothetical protein